MLVNRTPALAMPVARCLFGPRLTIAVALGWVVLGAGCATNIKSAATKTPTVPQPIAVGKVALVDEMRRFVLIDLQSNLYLPRPGLALRTTNAAGQTAHLRTTPEQKRSFITADIVDGHPAVGDLVLQ